MKYTIRFITPFESSDVEITGSDISDAIMIFLEKRSEQCFRCLLLSETMYTAIVSDVGHGQFVGRYFYSGIGRNGGVKRSNPLECKSLEELDWIGEETAEEAIDRKHK